MSSLFDGADQAAKEQIAGINKGLGAATNLINQGSSTLQSNYGQALQPFQSNYANAQQGTTALGNVLGLNGAAGSQSANAALQTMPGYQFALGQGDAAVNAAAAANGTLNSGNQLMALSAQNQGLASQNYNNYVNQLSPYLNYSTQNASGIGGLYSGLGNALNANDVNLANLNYGADTSIGNAKANASLADQSLDMNLLGGAMNFGSTMLGFL